MTDKAEKFIREEILFSLRRGGDDILSVAKYREKLLNWIMDNRKEWSSETNLNNSIVSDNGEKEVYNTEQPINIPFTPQEYQTFFRAKKNWGLESVPMPVSHKPIEPLPNDFLIENIEDAADENISIKDKLREIIERINKVEGKV